jgi:L-ascorbate metabolism protein UlaG (beta-lactamase superfamily)
MANITLTLIGGPTMLIEIGGLRLLTDPTFDPAGGEYNLGPVTLNKTTGPALTADSLGRLDAVLLSHEQHSDNLDLSGRALLDTVEQVFTTNQSAANLGPNAIGLNPWETHQLTAPDGRTLIITATPGRHGPVGIEPVAGDVTGFVLAWADEPRPALYISGDTVWYEGVAEVARRFEVGVALLNLGAARLEPVGPIDLTMNAEGAIETMRAFGSATLVPAHYEGWAHFSESQTAASRVLTEAGLTDRIHWLERGLPAVLTY